MTESADRPTARRRARPAADEAVDPMDTSPSTARPGPDVATAPLADKRTPPPGELMSTSYVAAGPGAARGPANGTPPASWATPPTPPYAPPATAARKPGGAYVTLNVRVAPDVDELINRVMAETGMTKRAAVETALRQTYSS